MPQTVGHSARNSRQKFGLASIPASGKWFHENKITSLTGGNFHEEVSSLSHMQTNQNIIVQSIEHYHHSVQYQSKLYGFPFYN